MGKVKQGGRKGTTSTSRRAKTRAPAKPRVTKASSTRAAAPRARVGKNGRGTAVEPPTVMRVRELVPQDVCGSRTTVQQLFRVTELQKNVPLAIHLVFLDRHGWYCEHGRNCPAVKEVMKLGKALVRTN